jgi:hypothetical protein
MTRPHLQRLWTLACVLLLALVMSVTLPGRAWGGRSQRDGSGGTSHRHDSHRHGSHHHGSHHRHGSHHHGHYYYRYPRPFFGLYFFDYPYPYPYYGPYYYESYAPGAHQRFPAFRLPEFFYYPGAIGKGELEDPQDQDTAVPLTPQRSIQP